MRLYLLLSLAACASEPTDSLELALLAPDLPQQGAFTCDLVVGSELDPSQVGPVIERDRILMSHPGMRQKMLPMAFGTDGNLLMGGRYLFDTKAQAEDYEDFVLHRYVLDGVQFVDRSYFRDYDCRHWTTIGAHEFADFRSAQVVLRSERWRVPDTNLLQRLRADWPAVRTAAANAGLSAVWLLYSRRDSYVELVYFADRIVPNDPSTPDFATYAALAATPPLGHVFTGRDGWVQDLDRTHWVYNIWQPYVAGDQGAPSIHPYSPPFPALSCGDGLCVPSRGETHTSCAADCPVSCGNATCEAGLGEDVHNCPSDCRVPSSPIQ